MEHRSKRFPEEEKEIALILLQLRNLIPPLPNWGRKRKRSAIQDPIFVPPHFTLTPLRQDAGAVATPSCDAQTLTAPSPATPVSFFPNQSHEKLNNLRRKLSLRKRKEVYLKNIKDLTESIALLNQEVDNVKGYCDKLKVYNLKLKARKEELTNGSITECKNSNLEFSSNSIVLNQNQMSGPSQVRNGEGIVQFHCVSANPTTPLDMTSSSSSGSLGHVNSNKGPLAIPDLNLTIEEFTEGEHSQPQDESMANKDMSRAMAAQARQRRIQIFRLKNPIRTNKSLCSY